RFTRNVEEIFRTPVMCSKIVQYYRTGKAELLNSIPYHIKLIIQEGEVKSASELAEKLTNDIGDIEHGYGIWLALNHDIEDLQRKARLMQHKRAKIVLSSAHSVKGLQFNKVNFGSDFPKFEDLLIKHIKKMHGGVENIKREDIQNLINCIRDCGEECGELTDELNLQYVAMTRVISELGDGTEAIRRNLESKPDVDKLYKAIPRSFKKS
ncbi:MAG: hypothetical protein NZL90_04730, partial [Aquificaceae bacterium]|nr:hypothetical protein [Aquificaceae bacterium]MDW8237843.1 hypothetical protein [Aquificaceae bacterium]